MFYTIQLETYLDSYIGQITRGPISDATSSTSVTDTAVKYVQSAAIYVGKNADSNFLYVSQNKDDLDSNDSADSNFLPYNPNKASYLIIKTLNWGLWFFTAELSGCEIWIATENGRTPVMFHVNTMNCDYSTEKLQQRENMAVDALNYINEQAGSNIYAFVYRLMAPRSVDAISQYLTGFHSRYPNVVVGRYDGDDGGIFYGETPTQDASDTTVVYAGWSFRCKNTINGQLFNIGEPCSYMFTLSLPGIHYRCLYTMLDLKATTSLHPN